MKCRIDSATSRSSISLLLENKVRCLAENADFDLVETKGKELLLGMQKEAMPEKKILRKLGHLPKLQASKPLLKLNEIIQYLKIYIHGKTGSKTYYEIFVFSVLFTVKILHADEN